MTVQSEGREETHDALIEYFLIDYVIDLGCHTVPFIRRELDAVEVGGCGTDFWMLLKLLQEDFDPAVLDQIARSNWMQKLSYKGEECIQQKAAHPEHTFYKVLFADNHKMEQ